tara:strand:- start:3906 stop:5477 length:1572 start_codon:yes stop_codon:yes gene_type:complete
MHFISTKSLIYSGFISFNYPSQFSYSHLSDFFTNNNIISIIDEDIVLSYSRDWSNIKGWADMVVKPKNKEECAIVLKTCYDNNIPITISAGKTNLTGSATPNGGIVLSIENLNVSKIILDKNNKEVFCPVGMSLEYLREAVLKLSNNHLYYPVDPTSRNDAYVGGTLSCNASGFIPGKRGSTRYWVNEIDLLLPNGLFLNARRGQYISKNGLFEIEGYNQSLPIPKYKRPNIKNASGPYSSDNGEIDFVDLIIGSEGIYGLIVSCKLKLEKKPKDYLELFLCLNNEEKAIDLHDFLYDYFNGCMSNISALEYFGYNSQKYMKHRNFLFKNDSDVGIYIQIPIYNSTLDAKITEWIQLINKFDETIDLDSVIVLNDPLNWKKFFEARHSIPDNALSKTRKLGGLSIITDTIVPPNNYRKYLSLIHEKLQKENIEYLLFGHLGDCHLHFHLIPSNKQEEQSLRVYDYMIDLSTKFGGVYSAEHGTGKRKRNDFKKCYGNEAVEMVKKSKLAVDPKLILNRGNIFN